MKTNLEGKEFVQLLPHLLPIILPVILLYLVLLIAALISILKKNVSRNYKTFWILVILLVNLIGPVIYFAVGSKMLDEKASDEGGDGK